MKCLENSYHIYETITKVCLDFQIGITLGLPKVRINNKNYNKVAR